MNHLPNLLVAKSIYYVIPDSNNFISLLFFVYQVLLSPLLWCYCHILRVAWENTKSITLSVLAWHLGFSHRNVDSLWHFYGYFPVIVLMSFPLSCRDFRNLSTVMYWQLGLIYLLNLLDETISSLLKSYSRSWKFISDFCFPVS